MARIIVVEDEELIRTMLTLNLEREGFQVSSFPDAESMLDAVANDRFDIMLLDIMLPGMSGIEALNIIRKKGINTPILMLTAKKDIESKVQTLDIGADDYIPKPFNMDELLARVRAHIRRSQGERSLPSERIIHINDYVVNLETREADTTQGKIVLSEKEVFLLRLFAQNPGKTLSRSDILEEVWGMDVDPTPRTIDNFIVRFRKLFEKDPESPLHFVTVRATGYRFEQ